MRGGAITSDIANLAVPLGLILSHAGLHKLMNRSSALSNGKVKPSQTKVLGVMQRASLSGGDSKLIPKPKPKPKPNPKPITEAVLTRNKYLQNQFQLIAKRVQQIFAKARSAKRANIPLSPVKSKSKSKSKLKLKSNTTPTKKKSKPKSKAKTPAHKSKA